MDVLSTHLVYFLIVFITKKSQNKVGLSIQNTLPLRLQTSSKKNKLQIKVSYDGKYHLFFCKLVRKTSELVYI